MLALGVLALAACQTPAPPPGPRPQPPAPTPAPQAEPGAPPQAPEPELPVGPGELTPPHMEGRTLVRIGLLLPFGAHREALRQEARLMLNAAQMAVFEAHDPDLVLMPRDSAGTAEGAQEAAAALIADGAAIIIGPVLSPAVAATAQQTRAAGIPAVAFSTDSSVAGNGVYLLSFMPEADIARMADFIAARNQAAFTAMDGPLRPGGIKAEPSVIAALALLRPEGAYGDRVEGALFAQAARVGLGVSDIARYGRDVQSMDAPVRQIAHVRGRQAAIGAWRKAGGIGDPGLDSDFSFRLPYQAIFVPESGVRLRSLAPLLPFYDVDPKITRFVGTHLWQDDDLLHEPALFGGWFPGPPAAARDAFAKAYEIAFGEQVGRLTSLAHDAVLMVPHIVRQNGEDDDAEMMIDTGALEQVGGFSGADGAFRFTHDGLVQRLLSVYAIRHGKFVEIDPAAAAFPASDAPEKGVDGASY